jgi:phosphoribosyl 1,2-cyclic phosphodiesterase
MPARFTVLSSSSCGNASYLEIDGQGVLVDLGIGPRKLVRLLDYVQVDWHDIKAVILTHLHGDHCREPTLKLMAKSGTPLWCHPEHDDDLRRSSESFALLRRAGLVRHYRAHETFDLGPCHCTPLPVWHDVLTFGFRFDGSGEPWSLGYATDLGSWAGDLVERLTGIDVLALEFNHDVQMQLDSQRSESLIERVLGDDGHLSNIQASRLLAEIVKRSSPGRLRHLVPLHLSEECNRPDLVHAAALSVRQKHQEDFSIHPAHPACPTPWFHLTPTLSCRSA